MQWYALKLHGESYQLLGVCELVELAYELCQSDALRHFTFDELEWVNEGVEYTADDPDPVSATYYAVGQFRANTTRWRNGRLPNAPRLKGDDDGSA